MKKLLFFCGVAAVLCSSCGKRIARVESVDIVPQPVSVVASDGAFDLTKNTKICLLSDDAELLRPPVQRPARQIVRQTAAGD